MKQEKPKHPRIIIMTPFRNEEHSIPQYLKSLKELAYPHELIDIFWLENDSCVDENGVNKTFEMLKKAKKEMEDAGFRRVGLKSVNIIGPQKKYPLSSKGVPANLVKDVPYGSKRVKPWIKIWNEHFIPWINRTHFKDVNYVLMWYADSVMPPTTIQQYLAVFRTYNNAGWVGGSICRRYPLHKDIRCPIPKSAVRANRPIEVRYVGHVWMMPIEYLRRMKFYNYNGISGDIHDCLIRQFAQYKKKVYYQPAIFIKHISADGKIYCHKLPI